MEVSSCRTYPCQNYEVIIDLEPAYDEEPCHQTRDKKDRGYHQCRRRGSKHCWSSIVNRHLREVGHRDLCTVQGLVQRTMWPHVVDGLLHHWTLYRTSSRSGCDTVDGSAAVAQMDWRRDGRRCSGGTSGTWRFPSSHAATQEKSSDAVRLPDWRTPIHSSLRPKHGHLPG